MKKRKAINFDLSTNALKKHFNNTAEAYNQIKSFMLENGFEHRQYSGYTSIEPINEKQVTKITEKLSERFAWLSACVQRFDVTDIGEQYDLTHLLTKQIQKDKATTQDLLLESKQDAAMKRMKERIEKFKNSGGLEKYTPSDKDKKQDKER